MRRYALRDDQWDRIKARFSRRRGNPRQIGWFGQNLSTHTPASLYAPPFPPPKCAVFFEDFAQ